MAGKKSDWVISLWVLVVFPLWWSDLLFLALFLVLFWLVLCGIILAPAIGLWPLDDGYVKHKGLSLFGVGEWVGGVVVLVG